MQGSEIVAGLKMNYAVWRARTMRLLGYRFRDDDDFKRFLIRTRIRAARFPRCDNFQFAPPTFRSLVSLRIALRAIVSSSKYHAVLASELVV